MEFLCFGDAQGEAVWLQKVGSEREYGSGKRRQGKWPVSVSVAEWQ